jgi:imidazolonepropionase-like amidohydrolase
MFTTNLLTFLKGPVARVLLLWTITGALGLAHAQSHLPYNGVRDQRTGAHLLINARIYLGPGRVLDSAMLLERNGRIVAVGANLQRPSDATVVDLQGHWLFPALVELFAEVPTGRSGAGNNRVWRDNPQMTPTRTGTYGANDAIRADQVAANEFKTDAKWAESYRQVGFGAVNAHIADGLARGSSVLLSPLGPETPAAIEAHHAEGPGAQRLVLRKESGAYWSFEKGSSTQDYPSSLMGCIALLRQTLYDEQWYRGLGKQRDFTDLNLDNIGRLSGLPQFFVTNNKYDILRAERIAKEFNRSFIYKGSGEEYMYLDAVRALGRPVVLPLRFPEVPDLSDPVEARRIGLGSLVHWDQAPANAALLRKAGVPIALTSNGLDKMDAFAAAVRKAIAAGLSFDDALAALTTTPARLLGMDSVLGSIAPGHYAHLIVASDTLFKADCEIRTVWIQGQAYPVKPWPTTPTMASGRYRLQGDLLAGKVLEIRNKSLGPKASLPVFVLHMNDSDRVEAASEVSGTFLRLSWKHKDSRYPSPLQALVWYRDGRLYGTTNDANQTPQNFWAERINDSARTVASAEPSTDSSKTSNNASALHLPEPWDSLRIEPVSDLGLPASLGLPGNLGLPTGPRSTAQNCLIREATVWTCGPQGRLENTDVAVMGGKIIAVGTGLDPKKLFGKAPYRTLYAAGLHLTPGLIDEHSHIAITRGVNEGTRSITSEVRIGDALDPDDPNIYRQLAGGVTTSHLLHGSSNSIGGQTQLIRMRWGVTDPEQLKFEGAPGFIKFALGENVKQSNWGDRNTVRFPQTRMGVEQTILDGFLRSIEYQKNRQKAAHLHRKDLTMEALQEIRLNQRHITCHSYVQSEINMLMKVADSVGFKVNTFTHILEGFKVADKMKAHGVNASSFADWWAYKYEVIDAIPYNAAILHRMGVNVAINSDDAEMARRLNQEAAKAVRYGGLDEVSALNMVTINPARMLRVDQRIGSIELGKDADLVLWNGHPLSVYSHPLHTIVEGRTAYEYEADKAAHAVRENLRKKLLDKALRAKNEGAPTGPAYRRGRRMYHCEDLGGLHDQELHDLEHHDHGH